MTKKDFFEGKAERYDVEAARVNNVTNIANLILKENNYAKSSKIMDFGSGTGLLLSEIAPHVNEITAVDISDSMNSVLKQKEVACQLNILKIDLTKENIDMKFDGIISSMTIHHIENIKALFEKFYVMLEPNGTIALSDLDLEDGSFHSEDTGIFHLGFDRTDFLSIAASVGFKDLKIQTASIIERPEKKFPVFLLTGNK